MGATNNYLSKNILDAVSELNHTLFLPDLQRPYVWSEEQIAKLFDSLMRGYPINTFLFWKVKREDLEKKKYARYRFVDHNEDISEKETKPFSGNECFFVLDGQQRLTSFNIGLIGYITKRKKPTRLYFNVLSGQVKDAEDLLFKFEFLPETHGNYYRYQNDLWTKVSWLVEQFTTGKKLASDVVQVLVPNSDPNYTAVFRNLEIFDRYFVHGNIYYYEESEHDEDRVLDIFIRTNAGGTKLGYSDLLFSKIKVRWHGVDARSAFQEMLTSMNEGGLEFDNDFILKTALVCLAQDADAVRFKLSNFDDAKVQHIETVWERLKCVLAATRDHLVNELYLSNDKLVTSYNALIPLVSYAFVNDLKTFERKGPVDFKPYYDDIREYVYRTLVTGAFGSQVDTTLWNIQEIILAEKGKPFPAHKIFAKLRSMGKQIEIQEEVVQRIQYGSRLSYPLLNIVYNRLGLTFKSNANRIQQDHIFSQKELKGRYLPEQINDIANIRFVSAAENNWKSDTPYAQWIQTLPDKDVKWHMIPPSNWTVDSYSEFLEKRRQLLVERTKQALNHFTA